MICPVCSKDSVTFFYCQDHEFEKCKMRLFQCRFCDTVFVDQNTISIKISGYYKNSYYERPGALSVFLQNVRAKKFEKINPGRILDVGCGSGFFLEKMLEKGWNCSGQEVSRYSLPYLEKVRKKGAEVFYGDIKNFKSAQKFDLITLYHVIEHVNDPVLVLKKIRKLLKAGGTLFIATPNAGSFSFNVFGCKWFHLDPPRHLIVYSPASLILLLEKSGFKVKKFSRFSFEYDPFGLVQSLYNLAGMEFNFLYKLIKNKKINSGKIKKTFYFLTILLTIVPVFLLSAIFSVFLGFFFKQDTIEVFAD
ncbi:MAG: class I SAM-dependent methyltransferase [archaeon]|nr:class I SAM-dependent methyltransferase [archaeon]